ncbi:unnamed protein product [Rhodiola kirilowii]
MGNCMETCLLRQAQDELHGEMEITKTCPKNQRQEEADHEDQEEMQNGKELGEIGNKDGGIVRVKIVLTKEELQWLMMQLKSDGELRLENMLEEIERGRKKVVCDIGGWKPSLESIMETPEFLEMDR